MNKLIIFPTDTVYGIGCRIYDVGSIQKIYEIKHRSKEKPLACLCADLEQIKSIAKVNVIAEKLISVFMPGALTIILESKEEVFQTIGYSTIGVRIPNHPLAITILKENGPMLTTSVNDSGEAPINSYEEVQKKYQNVVDKIYENEYESSNLSSTVIRVQNESIEVLREGSITFDMINKIIHV